MTFIVQSQEENKFYKIRTLDINVLVVASINLGVGDWAAYIGPVPGVNHKNEWRHVFNNGSKLPRNVAGLLFPDIAINYIWRD